MAQTYDIQSYFAAGKTISWAQYVDKEENGGNNNGKVDGNEIQLFKDIIKHRYNFDYSFDKLDSKQSRKLGEGSLAAKELYMEDNMRGPSNLGYTVSGELAGVTMNYDFCKSALSKLNSFPVGTKKYNAIKEFIQGFNLGDARNGIFEQMASEYGNAFKNKDVVPFMKTLIDNVAESKKGTKEYEFLVKTYNEYKSKPGDESFEDSKWSCISSFFGCNTMDNLDEAVNKLYDL